jgi:hypothetical protein
MRARGLVANLVDPKAPGNKRSESDVREIRLEAYRACSSGSAMESAPCR